MPLPRMTGFDARIDPSDVTLHDGGMAAMLAPIMAGARARGVADAFEMIGVGAVLVDGTGRVLHAGGRGRRMLGGHARIAGDHIVAERGPDNAAIERLISSAIGAGRHDPEDRIRLGGGAAGDGVTLRAMRFETDDGDAQLLRAVVILEGDRGI